VVLRPDALTRSLHEDISDYLTTSGYPSGYLDREPSEMDPKVFACLSLKKSLLKKLRPDSTTALDELALEKFLRLNSQQDFWSARCCEELFSSELLGYFREEIHRFFEPDNRRPLISSFEHIMHKGRFGPGASLGSLGQDFYTKSGSSDLTATSEIFFRSYRSYINHFPIWRCAEFLRQAGGFGERVVAGNKISFVPKNDDISRTICVEPSLNMFAQLGLGHIIESRLKQFYSIDLSTQPDINRALAKAGSISGNLCTIDLESASDSISLSMIEKNFPRDVVAWLKLLRSPTSETPKGPVELRMVSTMGNGFTFPLQTAIFGSVVLASKRFLGLPRDRAGTTWSVFGDDIIVSQQIAGTVLSLLRCLGFTVNPQKSFFEGPFRESCGHDYFRGYDVRGVYIKSLRTVQDRYVAINRLQSWSTVHDIKLPKTIRQLLSTVPYNLVPLWEADTCGIRCTSFSARSNRYGARWRYRASELVPSLLRFEEGTARVSGGARVRITNPEACLNSLLNGTLERGTISIRHDTKAYRTRTRYTLNWDVPSPQPIAGRGSLTIVEYDSLNAQRRRDVEAVTLR